MTVLSKSLKSEPVNNNQYEALVDDHPIKELAISMKSSHSHPSPMPESLKTQIRADAPSLLELFHHTVKSKGDHLSKKAWTGDQTLEVEGLSQLTLHSFILQAEKLGKNVEYVKTLTVKITD